ncbi:MAG: hypothetical protein COA88_15500 [Kordia sp.]|nr:MAG: hypothetical protein COA88_15500 [Kordia sp.]
MTFKNLAYTLLILAVTVATYTASLFEKGIDGYFGFSSLRVTVHHISFLVFCFLASLRLFHVEKGKPYRFIYLVPILTMGYNLFVNALDARKTTFNEFTPKLTITLLVVVGVVVCYFIKRKKTNNA